MAAPVVSGTVALMLQANPNLTPNLIKAILQYTASTHPGYNRCGRAPASSTRSARCGWRGSTRTRRPGEPMPTAQRSGASRSLGQPSSEGRRPSCRRPTRGRTTSSGARRRPWHSDGDNIVWGTMAEATTSSGARTRRRQHRLGHVASTATTSCGARSPRRRQHRLGHDCARRRRQHRVGHRLRRRRLRQHRLGHRRRRRQHRLGHRLRRRQHRVGHVREPTTTHVWGEPRATTRSMCLGRAMIEPLPVAGLEFGDIVPLVPVCQPYRSSDSVSIGGF